MLVCVDDGGRGAVRRGRAAPRLSELNEASRLWGILGGGMAALCVLMRRSVFNMSLKFQVRRQGVAVVALWHSSASGSLMTSRGARQARPSRQCCLEC